MAKHLTTEKQRAYLLKTLSEARIKSAHAHLEGCAECRASLEVERKGLAVLDVLTVVEAPDGLAERTLARSKPAVPKSRKQLSRRFVNAIAFAVVVLLFVYFGAIYRALEFGGSEASRRGLTQNNMKQFGLVFKIFADESKGARWPALVVTGEGWAPDLALLHEEILTDPQIMVSALHPKRERIKEELLNAWSAPDPNFEHAAELMGESFAYLGFNVSDVEDFEALAQAKMENAIPVDDSPISRPDGGEIQPLREGVERFLITDINNPAASTIAQSTIPVLIEIATWKYKKSEENFEGTNVLYMDGHVEFVPLGKFPVLPSILDALSGS